MPLGRPATYHRVVAEWFVMAISLLALPVVFLMAAAFVATSSLRRANRVLPGGRSSVSPPLWWLWSPGSAATLHRRLRAACDLAGSVVGPQARPHRWPRRSAAPPTDGIADLARDVLQEAVLLDREVVAASHIARGLPRSQALGSLDYQVRGVEDAARRVHQLAARRAQLARPNGPGALNLDQRIAAMEAALNELGPPPHLV